MTMDDAKALRIDEQVIWADALRDETASPPLYASLSSSVRYLGASAFTFSMNAT
jgi:hypothetical protein